MTILSVENLRAGYHGHWVLKDLSFALDQGDSVGLIGPIGAGKTTLLLAIAGLIPFEGSLSLSGQLLEKGNLGEIRKKIGIIFQNPDDQLFMPTVYEDIAFGPVQMGFSEEEVRKRVEESLKIVGLEGFGDRPSHHLSGGEKRASAIATVLSMSPEIILMDEPSSNLDPYHRRKMINLLKEMKGTYLIASHDLDLLWDTTSRCILLNGGALIQEGPTREVLSHRELLEDHRLELPLRLQGGGDKSN